MARVVDARGFGFWDGPFLAWELGVSEGNFKGGSLASQAISVSIDTGGLELR